jgi:hypothetical protein
MFSRWFLGVGSVNIASNNTPEEVFSVQSVSSLHKGDSLLAVDKPTTVLVTKLPL